MKFNITDIKWDTDGEKVDLPTNLVADIDIDFEGDETEEMKESFIEEELNNWLSDTFYWCHFGFKYELIDDTNAKYIIKKGIETDGSIEVEVLWVENKRTKEIVASSTYESIANKILEMLNNGELEVK